MPGKRLYGGDHLGGRRSPVRDRCAHSQNTVVLANATCTVSLFIVKFGRTSRQCGTTGSCWKELAMRQSKFLNRLTSRTARVHDSRSKETAPTTVLFVERRPCRRFACTFESRSTRQPRRCSSTFVVFNAGKPSTVRTKYGHVEHMKIFAYCERKTDEKDSTSNEDRRTWKFRCSE